MRNMKKQKTGFTLVEILISAAILSLFLSGLFTFYRMGSRMFVTGSWKLQKQKEAERFLSVLKERIEQASNASAIDPAGAAGAQLVEAESPFVMVNNNTALADPDDVKRLMLFSICKPDMSRFGGVAGDPGRGPGLILYHCLFAEPTNPEKKLYTLFFHADTARVAHAGKDYFNTAATFYPDPNTFPAPLGDFTAPPSAFSLGGAPYTIKLTEVVLASFSLEIASGTGALDSEKVVGISIKMQHPRYEETTVTHGVKAKLDYSVPLDNRAIGTF